MMLSAQARLPIVLPITEARAGRSFPDTLSNGVPWLANFMAGQSGGFWFDATKTDRMLQAMYQGGLPSTGNPIGEILDQRVWKGKSLAGYLATLPELVDTAMQTLQTATGSLSDGGWNVTSTSTYPGVKQTVSESNFGTFVSAVEWSGNNEARLPYISNVALPTGASGNASNVWLTPAGIANNILFFMAPSVSGDTFFLKFNSVKRLPGTAGFQASNGQRPTLQTSGLKFDGSDDNLMTNYAVGNGPKFMVALVDVPASLSGTQVIAGVNNTTVYFYMGMTSGGLLRGAVGNAPTTVGSVDRRASQVVVCLTTDGTIWRMFDDEAQAGSDMAVTGWVVPTSPMMVGAMNANGSPFAFYGGSIKKIVTGRQFLDLPTYLKIRTALLAA